MILARWKTLWALWKTNVNHFRCFLKWCSTNNMFSLSKLHSPKLSTPRFIDVATPLRLPNCDTHPSFQLIMEMETGDHQFKYEKITTLVYFVNPPQSDQSWKSTNFSKRKLHSRMRNRKFTVSPRCFGLRLEKPRRRSLLRGWDDTWKCLRKYLPEMRNPSRVHIYVHMSWLNQCWVSYSFLILYSIIMPLPWFQLKVVFGMRPYVGLTMLLVLEPTRFNSPWPMKSFCNWLLLGLAKLFGWGVGTMGSPCNSWLQTKRKAF